METPLSQYPADSLAATIPDLEAEHIRMPPMPTEYAAERYINVRPEELSKEALRGRLVLLDVWDYTCVNCIRTLPYINAWHEKYKDKGLVIIGIHSPEFSFEKEPGMLDSAVRSFGIRYPVIADNDFEVWQSLANQYWPSKYLVDTAGIIRAKHFGEGEYLAFEAFLQRLLRERDPSVELPPLTAPVRETDMPGAVCYRPTPEAYLGFSRSRFGNRNGEEEELHPNAAHAYTLPADRSRDLVYLEGPWVVRSDHASPAGSAPASLVLSYQAKEVNLVVRQRNGVTVRVEVEQDGRPLPASARGKDILEVDGKTYLVVSSARMHNIVVNESFGRFDLRLTTDDAGLGAYAFTFTSACLPPTSADE